MGNILKTLKFKRMGATPTRRTVVPNHLIPEDSPPKEQPNRRYATNKIETTKYSVWSFLPKNLFEQFHRFANLYFVFIVLLNWVPAVNAFGKEVAMIPLVFVLSVTALKDAFEDYRRYKSDKKINNLACRVYSRTEKKYERKKWEDIRVGDFVHLSCNEVIPADIILLHSSDDSGICHIDTSNLDGENNLKQRQIVWGLRKEDDFNPSMFAHTVECELPNMQIYKFNGAILLAQSGDKVAVSRNNILLRGCIIRNTDFVEGIVVYAGHDTKALMNNRGPRHKRSKLERQINRDVIWCVVALFLMCFMCSLGAGIWQEHFYDPRDLYFIPYEDEERYNSAYHAFLIFWTYVILFQVMIPISLYVTIEFVKLGQVYFIQEDVHLYYEPADKRIECRALNITEDLGQIEYIFSDKTGTLTENMMVFKRCSIAGTDYFPPTEAKEVDENGVDGKAALDQTLDTDPTNAFEENMLMEPTMKKALSRMSVNSMSGIDLQLPEELRKIQEFFLLMTICNTVVVSAHAHHDNMDASGVVHEDSNDSSKGKKKRGKAKNGRVPNHRKKNNSPYGTFAGKNGSPSPVGTQLESVNEDADSSISGEGSSSLEASSVTDITTKSHYEAESPDELALVQASSTYGCKLKKRTPDRVVVELPDQGQVTMRTLHILPFDSNRKRMSVIVENPITHEIILYCKGADSAIFTNLKERTPGDEVEEDLWHNTMDHLTTYAKEGLRTLCMAKRVLSKEEYKSWLRIQEAAETSLDDRDGKLYEAACEIETNLELLGATGIEDRLQDGVPETIASLRQAGIKVWVLTGDKQETALNIASSCHLISFEQKLIVLNARTKEHAKDLIDNHLDMLENRQNPIILGESMRSRSIRSQSIPGNTEEDEEEDGVGFRASSSQSSLMNGYFGSKKPEKPQAALVIDGKTLAFALEQNLEQDFLRLANHCNSVLCCRATPFQKSQLVKLVRDNLKKMTLAIGDGANDVAMIQTADVGIGISGQEGMQAVMSSDFALARFRFLKRLLLVHGHWCYERLAKMTLYMFYKNAVYIFMLMWFQIFSGFSGGTMVDDFNLMFFNLVYTSLPPILYGVFDRCASDEMLMAYPQLYKRGPKNKAYRKYSYFVAIGDATWQSLVEFFIPYFVYIGSGAGYWEFGVTCNAASVYATLLHLCIDTKYWSLPHWIGMILSILVFIVFNMVYGVICTACSPPANPYWVPQHTMGTAVHWFTVLLVVIVALGPRYIVYALRISLRPGTCERARQLERNPSGHHTHIASGYATWSSSTSSASVSVQAQRSNGTVENGAISGEMNSPRKREPWKRHRPTNSNGSIGPQNLPKPTSVPNVRVISEAVMTDPDSPSFVESPVRPTQTIYRIETTGQPQSENVFYSQIPNDQGDTKTSYTNPAYNSHSALSGTHRTESPINDTDSNINNSCSNLNGSASDNIQSGYTDSPSGVRVSDLPPPGGIRTELAQTDSDGDNLKEPDIVTIQPGHSTDDLVNLHSGNSTENLVTHL